MSPTGSKGVRVWKNIFVKNVSINMNVIGTKTTA